MDKKVISLQQLEEALRDMSRWIRDKLAGYIKEPEAEGQSGNVLMTNGAGGRSWGEVRSDDLWRPTVSEDGVLSWERSVNPNDPAAVNISGPAGKDGADGGYYTLRLTQPEVNKLQFELDPSKPDMPELPPVQVELPTGPGGDVDLEGYATEQFVLEYAQPKGEYLTGYTEIDPTVPGWAKEPSKPSYTKAEVGLGNVENVRQYSAGNPPPYPVTSVNGKTGSVSLDAAAVGARPATWMPTAQEVGALPSTYTPPNQTAAQVGADPKGTAAAAVAQHNTAVDSHSDIRLELKAINDRLTAFFDSDDQTLDEMSEIVAYITSNRSLIDSITTSKVSVADIINNLTTNVTNKPLSAAQGVALKSLIDGLDTALGGKLAKSELTNAINTALAQAKASGEFDGADGSNGKDGTSVTVKSVSESTEDGGSNVVTFSDGKNLKVKNGRKGGTGATGPAGPKPVKGVDYWTEADQEAIVQQVITALGTPVFGRVDENKHITLTGNYADGEYTYSFEDKDGNVLATGEFSKTTAPTYTNILPLAIASDKTPYNGGKGYKTGYRLNSGGAEASFAEYNVTGFIPVDPTTDVLYLKDIQLIGGSAQYDYIALYNANFTTLTSTQFTNQWANSVDLPSRGFTMDNGNIVSIDFKKWSNGSFGSVGVANWPAVAYIRFSCYSITDKSIITKNEPIE